jgi:hypothetical protein
MSESIRNVVRFFVLYLVFYSYELLVDLIVSEK